jgi:4-alpha-glucanotransferase
MRSDGFSWWISRIAFAVRVFDVVRIDHFRGFAAAWEVPGEDTTAENGKWVDVPGHEFFTVLEDKLGHVPMIAEDLGVITPDVEKLRDDFGLPGMRILQYGFGGDAKNDHLPHNYVNNSVAYTGTHDNDTVVGWWEAQTPKKPKDSETPLSPVQEHCMNYLNTDGSEINWDMIRAVWASVADTAIIPLQDVLGLGNEARMNYPSSLDGNWSWRYAEGELTEEMLARLKGLTETYGRVSK